MLERECALVASRVPFLVIAAKSAEVTILPIASEMTKGRVVAGTSEGHLLWSGLWVVEGTGSMEMGMTEVPLPFACRGLTYETR